MFDHPAIAFLGLGAMGRPMAARLLEARYPVTVWNRSAGRDAELVAAGARRAETPEAAVAAARFIILIVADPPAVADVLFGAHGVVHGAQPGAVVINCSTIDPASSRAFAGRAAAAGLRYVECPVMGSLGQARSGTLVALASGDADAITEAGPVVLLMAKEIVRAGPPGSASALKLVMNLLVGGITELLAESIELAERSGIAPELLRETLMSSVLGSPFIGYKAPQLVERRYDPLFSARLMLKDLALVGDMAAAGGVSLPATDAVREVYARTVDAGQGERDFAVVRETIAGRAAG